ncbi:SinI family restriction endonuclease [Turneriella parva]|uniref:Restriction endonuclease, type II, SinI n=1 Tax=Turneriella parva (strain ATCC BAA-1111 / DSM 21527 / NCTC 11395 / H) TaxID=869212 RepID=I4B1N1_TURPD|nr:SinI family restriction endonuclease [Turneriella parva]AFM11188.1 Restriction endonuclease, type II, SinI [Turneriella parva DSM 21527]
MRRIISSGNLAALVQQSREIFEMQRIDADMQAVTCLLGVLIQNPDLAPEYKSLPPDPQRILLWWLGKYHSSYSNRISQRSSRYPGTMPDTMVSKIIKARLGRLSDEDLKKISDAHRISMSSENILGLLLEEFLATHLKKYGWHCAWGESIKSVDFVSATGLLLQVKNRSNSENSSSSRVRTGTSILKWHRVNATTGRYNWEALNKIIGGNCALSEEVFEAFVKETLRANPAALAVEPDNLWL